MGGVELLRLYSLLLVSTILVLFLLLFLLLLVDYSCETGLVSSVLHWYGVWTLLDSFFLPLQVRLIVIKCHFQYLS